MLYKTLKLVMLSISSKPKLSLPLLLAVCLLLLAKAIHQINQDIHPDHFFDTPDFIRKYGYPSETHVVQSQDGYLTTLHRIPHGRHQKAGGKRPAVMLQHGIMCSSDTWVYKGPGNDLAFILADNGFDVWLGNARGNHYSSGHVNLSVNQDAYWQFTFHEMGYYDLPAVVDYILDTTKQKDIFYIGYSMGSTIFFVMSSTKPEYNNKIRSMIALAPVTVLREITTNTQYVAVYGSIYIAEQLRKYEKYQLFPRGDRRTYVIHTVCREGLPMQGVCKLFAFGLAGDSMRHYNRSLMSVVFSHVPAGTGQYPLVHFLQNKDQGLFQQFDWGKDENLKRYNQTEPPIYDLNNVQVPISVFYSNNDAIATPQSVIRISKDLPNVIKVQSVQSNEFNHFDFVWGLEASTLVYRDILDVLVSGLTEEEKLELKRLTL